MLNLRDISLRTLNPNQFPVKPSPRPYQLRLHFNGFRVKRTVYGLNLITLPFKEAFAAVDFPGTARYNEGKQKTVELE